MRTILAYAVLMIGALFWVPGASCQVSRVAHAEARPGVTHVVTSTLDAGPGSLRAAVAAAEDGDRITFGLTLPATVTLASMLTIQDRTLSVEGPIESSLTITATKPFGTLIKVMGSTTLTMTHLTVAGAGVVGSTPWMMDNPEGAIHVQTPSRLTLEYAHLRNNTLLYGGGLRIVQANVVLRHCLITNNRAVDSGGGISSQSCTLLIEDTRIEGNVADRHGGGIRAEGAACADGAKPKLTLLRSIIRENVAGGYGGGLYAGLDIQAEDTAITGNTAEKGGGIYYVGSAREATGLSVVGNTATLMGAGIHASGALTVTHFALQGNTCTGGAGGGLALASGQATLRDGTVVDNSSQSYGGGLYVGDRRAVLLAERVTISGNTVEDGVYRNLASGGGVALYLGTFRANDCLISGNYAKWLGGGVYLRSGTAEILASRILSNTTETGGEGGGVYTSTSDTAVRYGCIVGNAPTGFAYPGSSPSLPADATRNWWGSADGPGGEGPGDGDMITVGVDAGAFRNQAPQDCPCLPGRRCYGPALRLPMVTKA